MASHLVGISMFWWFYNCLNVFYLPLLDPAQLISIFFNIDNEGSVRFQNVCYIYITMKLSPYKCKSVRFQMLNQLSGFLYIIINVTTFTKEKLRIIKGGVLHKLSHIQILNLVQIWALICYASMPLIYIFHPCWQNFIGGDSTTSM